MTLPYPSMVDQIVQIRPMMSRRSLCQRLSGGLLAAFIGGCAAQVGSTGLATTSSKPLKPTDRLSSVGKRIAEVGLGTQIQFKFDAVNDTRIISVIAQHYTIALSSSAINLCENDAQLAALFAYTLVGKTGPLEAERSPRTFALSRSLRQTSLLGQWGYNGEDDIATIRALAKAGYDPRDAMVIWQHIERVVGSTSSLPPERFAAMATELRKLGYQV